MVETRQKIRRRKSTSTIPRSGGRASLRPPRSGIAFVDRNGPEIHRVATEGVKGRGSKLPYFSQIQRSFGDHDISHIQAFTDTRARRASAKIGALAYTAGERVAFGKRPTLHTAAHEAAHVIQQRSQIQLKGGLGTVGDRYEHHADEVADRVVQGRSVSHLLDRVAPTTAPRRAPPLQATPIQRTPRVREIDDEEEKSILKYKSDHYKEFNWLLRGQQTTPHFVARWAPKAAALTRALTKMHNSGKYTYTGTLYRGDRFVDYPEQDQTRLDTKGETITIASFLSTTSSQSFAKSIGPDLWRITSNINGVDIHAAGLGQKKEHEVLFPPGSQFYITEERRKVGMPMIFGGTRRRQVNAIQTA